MKSIKHGFLYIKLFTSKNNVTDIGQGFASYGFYIHVLKTRDFNDFQIFAKMINWKLRIREDNLLETFSQPCYKNADTIILIEITRLFPTGLYSVIEDVLRNLVTQLLLLVS